MSDGGGHGKGKGKGKPRSKCSPEKIRHAARLNAWRDSEDLPRKSPGSVTRAKARSAAFHAAKAAAQDARGIGPPVVKPPPPPPPPPRDRRGKRSENTGAAVRLVERDESPLPSQPGTGSEMASTVVLKERGEVLPRDSEESAEVQVHRDKRRADDQLQGTAIRQRGEVLPRLDPGDAQGNAQRLVTTGELLPQHAKALDWRRTPKRSKRHLASAV